jgi:hypothetical protein
MSKLKKVSSQDLKDELQSRGFFVDNLWTTEDVKSRFNCTEDEAQEVLYDALTNEATMERIWYAIDYHAQENELAQLTDNGYTVEQLTDNGYTVEQVKEYYLNSGFLRYVEEPFLSEYDDSDWIEHANESHLEL